MKEKEGENQRRPTRQIDQSLEEAVVVLVVESANEDGPIFVDGSTSCPSPERACHHRRVWGRYLKDIWLQQLRAEFHRHRRSIQRAI